MVNKVGVQINFLERIKNYFNPKKIQKIPDYQLRAYAMGIICSILVTLILIRYAWITFFPTPLRLKLIETGSKQFETNITLAQPRATITDRHGRILAVSVSRPSIFLLTKKCHMTLIQSKKFQINSTYLLLLFHLIAKKKETLFGSNGK